MLIFDELNKKMQTDCLFSFCIKSCVIKYKIYRSYRIPCFVQDEMFHKKLKQNSLNEWQNVDNCFKILLKKKKKIKQKDKSVCCHFFNDVRCLSQDWKVWVTYETFSIEYLKFRVSVYQIPSNQIKTRFHYLGQRVYWDIIDSNKLKSIKPSNCDLMSCMSY